MVEMIIKPNLTKAFLVATWLLAAPLLLPFHASATTYDWSGNHTNANWDINSYWSPSPAGGDWVGKAQANRDGAIIGIYSNITVYLNQDVYLSYLYLSKSTNKLLFLSDRIMRVEKTASGGDPVVRNSGTITLGANSSLLAYDGALVRLWLGGTVDLGASGTLGYTGTGTGSFDSDNAIKGGGAIAAGVANSSSITATNGTLTVTGNITNSTGTMASSSGNTLDLRSTITGGGINPSGGIVNLNGATLVGATLGSGTVNVPSSSSIGGGSTSAGTQLNINSGVLTVNSAVAGNGDVTLGNAGLNLKNNLGARHVTISDPGAVLTVAAGKNLTLTGDFSFSQTETSKWSWGIDSALQMSGNGSTWQNLEIGGKDKGQVLSGFSNNFNLAKLALGDATGAAVRLLDAIDNGHRGGSHGYNEALYVDALYVPTGTTLDLNYLHLYTRYPGLADYFLVHTGDGSKFGGGDIIGSPVPLPSGLLLLGSGLVGLAVFKRRVKKS